MNMERVTLLSQDKLFNSFLDKKYIPAGKDKYYLRNTQVKAPEGGWRHLTSNEIEALVKNDNTAMSWDSILVSEEFDPSMLKNNKFYGFVRIGRVTGDGLQYHDLRLPCGITNSSIHSCDIGDDCAIHNVHYLSHYIIGDRCMLFNIQEMSCTDHAKFGNGILKEGEEESVRVHLNVMNEAECRRILPFDGMIAADAYMWAKYIDDTVLQDKLHAITQGSFDQRRGFYGTVGNGTVIKNCLILKDVKIGNCCYIKGASKLKNITINSSDMEPTQIGENVVLVNGIVGYGCRIFYSCIAVKFVLCSHSNLKYGARLIDSFLGENSTISCCEVLNNLIFPAHEQHHNNSFLIASVVKGQSNMAAGATVGSNHNSRTNDNEIEAGRGFWPGLCSSVKHSSKFASYTMLSKADYPSEIINPMPFALLNNDAANDELQVMPAFMWMYNMYAMARNNWKYASRDKRIFKIQNIEYDCFAPDSMEEALNARRLQAMWTAKSWMLANDMNVEAVSNEELLKKGRELMAGDRHVVYALDIFGENMEKSNRHVRLLKTYKSYHAYGDMLTYYAVKNIVAYMEDNPDSTFEQLAAISREPRVTEWVNMGGQIMSAADVDAIRADIRKGELDSWKAIHHRYDEIWKRYPMEKLKHALRSYCDAFDLECITPDMWLGLLDKGIEIQEFIADQVFVTRKKDYDNIFRQSTFRNEDESKAAWGRLEENEFIVMNRKDADEMIVRIQNLKKRLTN